MVAAAARLGTNPAQPWPKPHKSRVSGRSTKSWNLETEVEGHHKNQSPWWGPNGGKVGGFTSKPPHRCPGLIWSLGIRDNPISCSAPCWCLCRKRQGQGRGQRPFRAAAPFPPVVPSNGEKAGNTKGKIYSSIAKKSRLLSLSQYRTLMSWTGRLQPAAPESSPLLRMSTNPQCAVLPYTLPIHPPAVHADALKHCQQLHICYQNIYSIGANQQQPQEKKGTLSMLSKDDLLW